MKTVVNGILIAGLFVVGTGITGLVATASTALVFKLKPDMTAEEFQQRRSDYFAVRAGMR